MALPCTVGREFPEERPGGEPCRHLAGDRCGIHDRLLVLGWRGCAEFECFGAGQQVTQVTYGGRDWRADPGEASRVFAVFGVMRGLHEMRFLLADPACVASTYAAEARALAAELEAAAGRSPGEVLSLDLALLRGRAGDLFARVAAERGGRSHRGALLMAADLRGADLAGVDLLGADLRDADVRGADLSGALFLTQPQLNAARGDAATRLPSRLTRPGTWLTDANLPG